MGQNFSGGNALTVVATGKSQATSGTSAGGTIPVVSGSNGAVPLVVRVSATAAAYFRMGAGAQTAVAGDLMIQPGDAILLAVPRGVTNFAALQVSAAGVLQISPVES